MTSDKTYFAVPTVTRFLFVRNKIKAGREYTNKLTGDTQQRVETEGKRVEVTFTTYQRVSDKNGRPLKYVDLGDDTFVFHDEVPSDQDAAGGDKVTAMADVVDQPLVDSLKNVLVEVMTATIPDFADQPHEVGAVAVPRYFHIDRIQFNGRADQPGTASLMVLLGVYSDPECTVWKRYIQQDFLSDIRLAEMQADIDNLTNAVADTDAQLKIPDATEERKTSLALERKRFVAMLAEANQQLADSESLTAVLNKPSIKAAIRELTENVLNDCVSNATYEVTVDGKPETRTSQSRAPYARLDVPTLISHFDDAYETLKAAIVGT